MTLGDLQRVWVTVVSGTGSCSVGPGQPRTAYTGFGPTYRYQVDSTYGDCDIPTVVMNVHWWFSRHMPTIFPREDSVCRSLFCTHIPPTSYLSRFLRLFPSVLPFLLRQLLFLCFASAPVSAFWQSFDGRPVATSRPLPAGIISGTSLCPHPRTHLPALPGDGCPLCRRLHPAVGCWWSYRLSAVPFVGRQRRPLQLSAAGQKYTTRQCAPPRASRWRPPSATDGDSDERG